MYKKIKRIVVVTLAEWKQDKITWIGEEAVAIPEA